MTGFDVILFVAMVWIIWALGMLWDRIKVLERRGRPGTRTIVARFPEDRD